MLSHFPFMPKYSEKEPPQHVFNEYVHPVVETIPIDKYTMFRGVYPRNFSYAMIYLVASVGLQNVSSFPLLVYLHGGSVFLVVYLLLSIAFAIPMLVLESGLAQFYSKGESLLFEVIPFLRGIGWSIHVVTLLSYIPYCFILNCILQFFMNSLYQKPPWSFCSIKIPNITCVNLNNRTYANLTHNEMDPSSMFFEFKIIHSRNVKDGSMYTLDSITNDFCTFSMLMMLIIWSLVLLYSICILRMYLTITYITSILSSIILAVLTIKSLFLPGSLVGIFEYLTPDLSHLLTSQCLKSAVSHIILSLCITKSMAAYASLNNFKFDFVNASFFVIFGDFIFGFVSGILIFSNVGFLSKSLKVDFKVILKNNLIFVNMVNAGVINQEWRIWISLFMFMLLIICISCVGVTISSFTISMVDFFQSFINYSEIKKYLIAFLTCAILTLISFSFSLKGSILIHDVFVQQLNDFVFPCMMLCEVIMIHCIYGEKRLRLEIKMMLGYTYNIMWTYFSFSLVPFLIILEIIFSIYTDVSSKTDTLAILISKFIAMLSLIPLIYFFIIELIQNYRSQNGWNIIKCGFTTPEYYGPYYKINWLYSKYYRRKLIFVRKDPNFLKTIRETEDLITIVNKIKNIHKSGNKDFSKN